MTKPSVITANANMDSRAVSSVALLLLLALVCGLVMSSASRAGENDGLNDDLFIPDNLDFYNPLQEADGHRDYNPQISGMDNVALYRAAGQYRNSELSASQRALNHQWMQQYHNGDGVRHGGKVFSKLFQIGLKTYWKSGKFGKGYLPDDKGNGRITEDIDYRLRMSGNKLKLSVLYEF